MSIHPEKQIFTPTKLNGAKAHRQSSPDCKPNRVRLVHKQQEKHLHDDTAPHFKGNENPFLRK